MLPRKVFGRTGLSVTQLGFGTMGLRGPHTWGVRTVDDAAAEACLNAVLDAGINFIDTAPDYGVCEERIGRFIGHRRKEFILATKCGCDPIQHPDSLEIRHTWTRDVIQRNLETSLKRLQTDFIDLLQFHGGDAQTLQSEGLIEQLLQFREQGLIKYIGVSSSLPQLSELIRLNVFDAFQIPYSCLAPQHEELLEQAAATGAGIIIRGGIAQGGPDAEIQRDPLNAVWRNAGLDDLLTHEMNRAELILRATLSQPACHTTIIGTSNRQHLAENVAAASKGPLSEDLLAEIKARVKRVLPSTA